MWMYKIYNNYIRSCTIVWPRIHSDSLNVAWMETDSLWTEHSLPVICSPWFSRFCSPTCECCTALKKCHWLHYKFWCVCMHWICDLRPLWTVPLVLPLPTVFLWLKWMDGWKERKKEESEEIVDLMDWLLTYFLYPSLSHVQSQHLISSHMLSHWVRNQSFSLPLSLPIYLYLSHRHFILAILYQSNTLTVGTNERVSLQSHSNHTTSSLGLF